MTSGSAAPFASKEDQAIVLGAASAAIAGDGTKQRASCRRARLRERFRIRESSSGYQSMNSIPRPSL
jgi:hypothetical protein